jgi:hypothetical protein
MGWNATNDFKSFVPICYEQKIVTVYAVPNVGLNVVPSATTTCSGGSVNVIIQSAQSGFLYQLQNDVTASPLSGFYSGTGGNLTIPSTRCQSTQRSEFIREMHLLLPATKS